MYMTKSFQANIELYSQNKTSFIADMPSSEAVKMPFSQVWDILDYKLGDQFKYIFDTTKTVDSPLKGRYTEGGWLKKTNIVGINVRTIQNFWNVVKYSFTLSETQSSVHLLPIWEPGVVASLYGISSWCINPEFISPELYAAMPELDTVEKQLKVVINILHALGKTVGMDVIPHTDRYSEQVIANPQNFEWLQRIDYQIVRHENNLHEAVQDLIFNFLKYKNPSILPPSKEDFFSKNFSEEARLKILFGDPYDYAGRLQRREEIIQALYYNHFETVPATMGPPYRGLKVDTEGEAIVDKKGRTWLDYTITKPEKFSRVFGPLTRFKLYENKDNNADWAIDFEKPIVDTWEYAANHYAQVQAEYNFDYMRGDMAHVQMRPEGVPPQAVPYYDLLQYIKNHIAQVVPYFGYYAETFLAPAGEMAYGDEVEHLERSEAEVTLGDLQSMVVGSKRFMAEFARYDNILHTRKVAPCFTIMTADKDDPRFDEFYLKGNEVRFFMGLFLTDMPSYMGLGFEMRDDHSIPAPNEYYTKLYVFQLDEGPKATHGPYIWGKNEALFSRLNNIKKYSDSILKNIQNADCQWLILPDAKGENKIIVWTQKENPQYVFVANLDILQNIEEVKINIPPSSRDKTPQYAERFKQIIFDFSTLEDEVEAENCFIKDTYFIIKDIKAGEGRAYKIVGD
jgi:hypothetical protein